MARRESDREDLLREATALVERIELAPLRDPHGEHVTAGFRAGGALSIFFGADPVYQFNSSGELRRAYCNGMLLKAFHGRLVSLRRERQPGEVQLLSQDLSESEQAEFLTRMQDKLRTLARQLEHGEFEVVGQVPATASVLGRIRDWLSQNSNPTVANSPGVK
jgi:hypothetical protein